MNSNLGTTVGGPLNEDMNPGDSFIKDQNYQIVQDHFGVHKVEPTASNSVIERQTETDNA
jgi:hypothetical protein